MASMNAWFRQGIGRWVRVEERRHCRRIIRDIFGLYGAQLGNINNTLLALSPIRNHFVVERQSGDVVADWRELPFQTDMLDLLILPHTLEIADDPHAVLREAVRVLRPEGRLVIIGFNPYSLLGLSTKAPWRNKWLSIMRLKDWLALLNMQIVGGTYGVYQPPWRWGRRLRWIEHAGRRWWPIFGGVFILHAIKRRHNMRLMMASPFGKQARLGKDLVSVGTERGITDTIRS